VSQAAVSQRSKKTGCR